VKQKLIRPLLAIAIVSSLLACGGAYDPETDEVTELSTYISCPTPPPGTIVSSWHSCGERKLYCYANNAYYASVSWPTTATSCCPSLFCPNQKCYAFTTASTLTCQ
jgi:hypothetical protein